MSQTHRLIVLGAIAGVAAATHAQPVCLVSSGNTLYRVNADGAGGLETFADQPSVIIGMTLIPNGAPFPGCAPGDVLAVEPGPRLRLWRIDNARAGVPQLAELGMLAGNCSSITFANLRLHGTGSGGVLHEYDPETYQQVGNAIDMGQEATGIGGLSHDGAGTWYIVRASTDQLYRCNSPATANCMTAVGPLDIDIDSHGTEMYNGELWLGGFRGNELNVGTLDTTTGRFTARWVFPGLPGNNSGFVAFDPACAADLGVSGGLWGRDGVLDNNDFIVFISHFFAVDLRADVGVAGGLPGSDGEWDNNDFIAFINLFFSGC
jgi:hypothetical protein